MDIIDLIKIKICHVLNSISDERVYIDVQAD